MSGEKKIDLFIFRWNNEHPYDYEWRQKYKIPFGSEQHKGISFIDQVFDLREAELVEELRKEQKEAEERKENEMLGLKDDKKVITMDAEDIDKEFADLDINQLYVSDTIKESSEENLLD